MAPARAYMPASIPESPLREMNFDDFSMMVRMEARSSCISCWLFILKVL